jgi:hypothetical protein
MRGIDTFYRSSKKSGEVFPEVIGPKVWRAEWDHEQPIVDYRAFLKDGTQVTLEGKPLKAPAKSTAGMPAPRAAVSRTTEKPRGLVGRWAAFERSLAEKDLAWALHYAPAHLRYARQKSHPRGTDLGLLLPADYREFVAAIGYPVVAFCAGDPEGISFLPPEAMSAMSAVMADLSASESGGASKEVPAHCAHAFFAGHDLSDMEGFCFGAQEGGDAPVVWLVEGSQPREQCGTFTEWLTGELDRLEAKVDAATPEDVAEWLAENDGDIDPHRLIDYSLDRKYDVPAYAQDDLGLCWVEHQAGTPYEYGLIDAGGVWRIPMGRNFKRVRPFRGGVAEVILNRPGSSYGGLWTKIRVDGSTAPAASKEKAAGRSRPDAPKKRSRT